MTKIDVIIPVCAMIKAGVQERIDAIRFGIETFYSKQSQVDLRIVMIEQKLDEKEGWPFYSAFGNFEDWSFKHPIMGYDLRYKGFPVYYMGVEYPVFNKAWLCNVGVRAVRGEYFVIAESDMWAQDDYFWRVIEQMKDEGQRWTIGWNRLYYTNEAERDQIMQHGEVPSYSPKRITGPKPGYSEGGLVFFKKELYTGMGWANEFMQELGGPDTDLAFRAQHACPGNPYNAFQQSVFHLHHGGRKRDGQRYRKKNIAIIHAMRENYRRQNNFLRSLRAGDTSGPWCKDGSYFEQRHKWENM